MCNHRPKEILRAMFSGDAILTCKKCGKEIYDTGKDRRGFSAVSVLCLIVLIHIMNDILSALVPQIEWEIIVLAAALVLYSLGWYIYICCIAEYEEV